MKKTIIIEICDRCKVNIKADLKKQSLFGRISYLKSITNFVIGGISFFVDPYETLENRKFGIQEKGLCLCPKCTKDFKDFMKQ